VAGLAADVDLGPGRVVGAALGVEALDEVGRMALGAHAVPVLGVARPVEPVGARDPLARIQEEPPLPRHVPRQRERLHPTSREADQVLLQGVPAEAVGHLEHGRLAVRPVRLDQVLARVAEEAGLHPVALEHDPGEVATHRRLGRLGHRQVVVRARPGFRLLLVAAGARHAPHERRLDCHAARGRRRPKRLAHQVQRAGGHDQGRAGERGGSPALELVGHPVSPA